MRLTLLLFPLVLSAQFEYDRSQPFDTKREELARHPNADLWGDGFAGPKGGRVNFVLVVPTAKVKPHYAGVIFQHGGGQSMTNYISEALILAERGVISIIPDAPARGERPASTSSKLDTERDSIAEIVVCERRTLDYLLQQPGIDPKRIAYVGHSYGAAAGGTLAGIEPRISTFVLMGGIAKHSRHIAENQSEYWQKFRNSLSADELQQVLRRVAEVDPDQFLARVKAPILVQCARFDTDDNMASCPAVHQAAGGPKRLTWYDDDHNFTSLDAMLDRLYWLESKLKLRPVKSVIEGWLRRPAP
jgi:cephalosporin-C deacetylase-like acetyl esterase